MIFRNTYFGIYSIKIGILFTDIVHFSQNQLLVAQILDSFYFSVYDLYMTCKNQLILVTFVDRVPQIISDFSLAENCPIAPDASPCALRSEAMDGGAKYDWNLL